MKRGPSAAYEGLLASAERWAPADAERWERWCASLTHELRSDVLLPLQAVLCGLVAFRSAENHPLSAPVTDFRPHLHAVRVALRWALNLVARLPAPTSYQAFVLATESRLLGPQASLRELERSLTDALRASERLLQLPAIDEATFHASLDLFVQDLDRNAFFRPPEPLELTSAKELVSPGRLAPALDCWKSDSAKMATLIAFLVLLRNHRFLGIADRQIGEPDGLYRAHVIAATVRKELRTLSRFLLVRGAETFADELEARLLSMDAQQIASARAEITRTTDNLRELRESVEALAMEIQAKAHSGLDIPLPGASPARGLALPAERMRSGIRELRATIKGAAKSLRSLGHPAEPRRSDRTSARAQMNLRRDVWAFRFILRAFVAKASAACLGTSGWGDAGGVAFAAEFVQHFRLFGPRLARATDYERGESLLHAVSTLAERGLVDAQTLDAASRECELFAEHLDRALSAMPQSLLAPFDKYKAAEELRGYLAAAKDQSTASHSASGAFSLGGHAS